MADRSKAKSKAKAHLDKDKMQEGKPVRTPSHPTKSHAVKHEGKLIRFGEQGAKTNQSASQRKAFRDRHRKNIARGKSSPAWWANKYKWKGD